MVETRGQQVVDQSPLGSGDLQGVTAEGDVVATTVCSGNALNHAVSAPSADPSANTLRSEHTDKEGLASREGADSPTHISMSFRENESECADSVNVPQDVNAHLLDVTPHVWNGTGIIGSIQETGSCPSVEGAAGGATSAAFGAFFNGPPRGYPAGQPLIFGDLSSGAISVNPCSHCSVTSLFGLPIPVYTGTVQAGAPCIAPMGAACARSALLTPRPTYG